MLLLWSSLALALDLPQLLHIAYADNGQMTVSWATKVATSNSFVFFGPLPAANASRAGGRQVNYFPGSVWIHHVILPDLLPSTLYYYKCGDPSAGFSDILNFTSAIAPGSTKPFTVAIFGDLGIDAAARSTLSAFTRQFNKIDFFYSVGDHTYADDRPDPNSRYEGYYNTFQQYFEPLISGKPLMVIPGNHDASCHSYGDFFCDSDLDNFTAYRNRWSMPNQESSQNMWWSMDVGLVHFVAIDTETDIPNPGDGPEGYYTIWNAGPFGNQMEWLKRDLAAANANRRKVPWIVVTGHRPIFSAHVVDFPPGLQFEQRDILQPIFEQYGVDLYVAAHVHAYERHWPIWNSKKTGESYTNPVGVVYVVNGAAGNIEGLASFDGPYHEPWMDVELAEYGYGMLDIVSASTLVYSFHSSADDSVQDTFTLIKQRS